MTNERVPINLNQRLDRFEAKCEELWQARLEEDDGDMTTTNRVCVEAAKLIIPIAKPEIARRMQPSARSIAFAERRALEIERGASPQRVRELHRQMCRHRRRDYRQWHIDSVDNLNQCVKENRWHAARKWSNALRGKSRQARVMPSRGYKVRSDTIRSNEHAVRHWRAFMADFFARTLADRARYGDAWPEILEDVNAPGSEWCDAHFNWACDRVHEGRAAGLNDIQVELYKYSKWAREHLRSQLKRIWETALFPKEMLTGIATPCFKSGDPNDYLRYRILVVFPAEYKIFATMLLRRIVSECANFLRDFQSAFCRGRGTPDNQYVATQLYRLVCGRGAAAIAVHMDYNSAFDSLSHVYLFKAMQRAGASGKTLQLFKAVYSQAQIKAKVGDALSEPVRVGRGVLEGDVYSPMCFNIGLEQIFREADSLNSAIAPMDGIKVRDLVVDKLAFADDLTALAGGGPDRASTTMQNIQFASERAGLRVSAKKTFAQHIGRGHEAPPVTVNDLRSLKMRCECPKPWCTRMFSTKAEVRAHVVWHDKHEGNVAISQSRLAQGTVVSARGLPHHRFFLVSWADGELKWVHAKHFGVSCQHRVDAYFMQHYYLNRESDLQLPWEARCTQCNALLPDQEALKHHVDSTHTYPVVPGTVVYRKAMRVVRQRHQETLPKVRLLRGHILPNRCEATWYGMMLNPEGDTEGHVQQRILMANIIFGEYREMFRSSRLRSWLKISTLKSAVITKATFGCEVVRLTARVCRRYATFNARCCMTISRRSFASEMRNPSFDLLSWIKWRRATWLGKGLRGEKGHIVRECLHWNFQNRRSGDVYHFLPAEMKASFYILTLHAERERWQGYTDSLKPEGWNWFDEYGEKLQDKRRSPRLEKRGSDERALRREELRRSLLGTAMTVRPEPTDLPPGELHAYTDGSALSNGGNWWAGCGVWFSENSPHNISTTPRGKQTVNRAELTAVILAIRKFTAWPVPLNSLTVFSDSKLCVDGINIWLPKWKADGWARKGKPLKNADLWRLVDRILSAVDASGLSVKFVSVPAHAGIYGNEKADRLANAAATRAKRRSYRTAEERLEHSLERMADDIVARILRR